MNYNILILSNKENYEEYPEDIYIAEAFKKDGNKVDILWVDYDENLDENYDIIIRRNTWVEEEKDTKYYQEKNSILKKRLLNKNIKTINLIGLDGGGKEYLIDLYKEEKKVIPTFDNADEALENSSAEEYVIKDNDSFGSGIGQKIVSRGDLKKEFIKGSLIQPKLKFISEVQTYFAGDKLMYVYEYTPSKYPDYPMPHLITLTEEQEEFAKDFDLYSPIRVGAKRIDFLKLENGELILLEIEDNSPHMNLEILDEEIRNQYITEYKKQIYKFVKN